MSVDRSIKPTPEDCEIFQRQYRRFRRWIEARQDFEQRSFLGETSRFSLDYIHDAPAKQIPT